MLNNQRVYIYVVVVAVVDEDEDKEENDDSNEYSDDAEEEEDMTLLYFVISRLHFSVMFVVFFPLYYCVIFFFPSPTFMLCCYLSRSLCMELRTKPFDHRPRKKEHMYSNGVVIELVEFLHFNFSEGYIRYIHISPLNY